MFDALYQVEYKGVNYTVKHGDPFDRGSADSYYGRRPNPHKYPNGTGNPPLIEGQELTDDEVREYNAGYAFNEESGDKKVFS
jgi:hypothetical protein